MHSKYTQWHGIFGFYDIIDRFFTDPQFRYRMTSARNWDAEGNAARGADAAAAAHREPANFSYDERERRGYWRQVPADRQGRGGGDTGRRGYYAPWDPRPTVPGATPGGGDKGKGKSKFHGKRSWGEAGWGSASSSQ